MGKKPINQSLQKELSWYLSTLKYLQEGIEMVKEQGELLELPLDLSIDLEPPKKKEDLMLVAQKAEAQLRIGEKEPIIYLYTKLAVDHFRELRSYIRRNHPKNKKLTRFISAVQKEQSLDSFVDSYYEKMICAEPHCIDSIVQLLGVIYKVPQASKTNIEQFLNLMNESSKKITSLLFNEKSEEFVQMVDNLSLDEVMAVLQTISIIDLVASSKKTVKFLESLGN